MGTEIKIDIGNESLKEVFLKAAADVIEKYMKGDEVMPNIRSAIKAQLTGHATIDRFYGLIEKVIDSDINHTVIQVYIKNRIDRNFNDDTIRTIIRSKTAEFIASYLRNNINEIIKPIIQEVLIENDNFKKVIQHQALLNVDDRVKKLIKSSVKPVVAAALSE